MKRLSMAMTALAVMGLMTMVSCRKPNVNNVVPGAARTVTFNAATESNGGSKTTLVGLDVKWSAGDRISVNGATFTLETGEGTTFGSFTGTITGSAPYLAGYPQASTTYTAEPKSLKLSIPATYTYDDTKVEIPMVAITNSEDGDLSFRNAVNVLKLKLTGDGTTASKLTSIVLKSSTSAINGDIAVTFSGATPTFGYADGTTTTTVNFAGGKQLGGTAEDVYIVLPKIDGGELTIKFNCSNGKYMKKKITVTSDFNAVNNSLGNSEALTVNATTETPYIAGDFTVNKSTGKKVNFAKGNLYWDGTVEEGKRWKIESNQWDFQSSYSSTWADNNHISHFKWGNATEAIDGTTIMPTGEFFIVPNFTVGGETWFILSNAEWGNLLGGGTSARDNASSLRGWRTVAGVDGLVILPDNTENPGTVLSDITTAEQLAAAGAVFLPAAGCRFGTGVNGVGSNGNYWSSTPYGPYWAYYMGFNSGNVYLSNYGRDYGYCVRLVR